MGRGFTIAAMEVAERMTADEYLAMDDERRGVQLIAGEVVVSEPLMSHQRVVGALYVALVMWVQAAGRRGEVVLPLDVKLDEDNVFAPDLLFYAPSNMPENPGRRPYPMPDLAIEVRSPSTWRYDLGIKKSKYEAAGLRELWLVDTESDTVVVFRRSASSAPIFDLALEPGRADTLTSPLLPGFELALGDVFAR